MSAAASVGSPGPKMARAEIAPHDSAPKIQDTEHRDCAGAADCEQADKELSTIRARLALAGWVMHIVDAGDERASFWVSRWGRSATLPDRHALLRFMQQAGVVL